MEKRNGHVLAQLSYVYQPLEGQAIRLEVVDCRHQLKVHCIILMRHEIRGPYAFRVSTRLYVICGTYFASQG